MTINTCVPFKNTTFFDETDGQFNDTITFFPVMTIPYVVYNQPQDDIMAEVYQICGPLIMLLKSFARKQNARLQLISPMTDAVEAFLYLVSEPPDFILTALAASMFNIFQDAYKEFEVEILYTSFLGVEELSNIAYKKYPDKGQIFPFFQHLKPLFCILAFTCLFLIAAALAALNKSPRLFVKYSIDLVSTIFSYNMPKLITNRKVSTAIIFGAWLIISTILSILFRNYILEDMVTVIPEIVIDSWDDLYNRPEVRIISESTDLMTSYAKGSKDDMAKSFLNRLDVFLFDAFFNKEFVRHVLSDLSSGRSAFIMNRLTLIYALKYMQLNTRQTDPTLLEHIHVSKYGGEHVPYFTILPKRTGSVHISKLNQLITQLRESGIYDQWTATILRSDGFLKLFDNPDQVDLFKFEQVKFDQVIDLIYMICIGSIISALYYIGEVLYNYFVICPIRKKQDYTIKLSENKKATGKTFRTV